MTNPAFDRAKWRLKHDKLALNAEDIEALARHDPWLAGAAFTSYKNATFQKAYDDQYHPRRTASVKTLRRP